MLVISDTSALSALAEVGLLDVLPRLHQAIVITESVANECKAAGAPETLRAWIARPPPWLVFYADPVDSLLETNALGRGEASAISLAWQHRNVSLLIVDERRARKLAEALGLSFIGLVGIVASAARRGLVDYDQAIQQLIAANFHLSPHVIEAARPRPNQP